MKSCKINFVIQVKSSISLFNLRLNIAKTVNDVSLECVMSKRDGQVQHPKLLEKRENVKILDHEKSVFHAAR